jgi:hypothetical protein
VTPDGTPETLAEFTKLLQDIVFEALANADCKIPASFDPMDHPLMKAAIDTAVKKHFESDLAKLKIWWEEEDKPTHRLTMYVQGPEDVVNRCGWGPLDDLASKIDVDVTVVEPPKKEETF